MNLKSIGDAIMHEISEPDPKDKDKPTPAHDTSPQVLTVTTPMPFAPAPMPPAPIPSIDQDVSQDQSLALVKSFVYGSGSAFTKFLEAWESSGRADPVMVLKIMGSADKSETATAIQQAITQHLSSLNGVVLKANADFDNTEKQLLGATDNKIAAAQAANQTAANEIARHQKETSERNQLITQLQQTRSNDGAKILAARQQTADAENKVKAELTEVQQLLNQG